MKKREFLKEMGLEVHEISKLVSDYCCQRGSDEATTFFTLFVTECLVSDIDLIQQTLKGVDHYLPALIPSNAAAMKFIALNASLRSELVRLYLEKLEDEQEISKNLWESLKVFSKNETIKKQIISDFSGAMKPQPISPTLPKGVNAIQPSPIGFNGVGGEVLGTNRNNRKHRNPSKVFYYDPKGGVALVTDKGEKTHNGDSCFSISYPYSDFKAVAIANYDGRDANQNPVSERVINIIYTWIKDFYSKNINLAKKSPEGFLKKISKDIQEFVNKGISELQGYSNGDKLASSVSLALVIVCGEKTICIKKGQIKIYNYTGVARECGMCIEQKHELRPLFPVDSPDEEEIATQILDSQDIGNIVLTSKGVNKALSDEELQKGINQQFGRVNPAVVASTLVHRALEALQGTYGYNPYEYNPSCTTGILRVRK